MSAQSLADLSFPVFMIAIGVLAIIVPLEDRGGQSAMSRWLGLAFIVLGGVNLLRPGIVHGPGFLLTFAGLAFLMALYLLLIEPWIATRKLRRYEAELSRAALATDEYSESLRAFHANSPFGQSPLRRWLCAGTLILFGGLWLVLGLTIPR